MNSDLSSSKALVPRVNIKTDVTTILDNQNLLGYFEIYRKINSSSTRVLHCLIVDQVKSCSG